uniref:Uncharacterized protein n=1 Tax=Arundo donax TaxID=35708 RepID=A0A0A8Y3I6_ARUDO
MHCLMELWRCSVVASSVLLPCKSP